MNVKINPQKIKPKKMLLKAKDILDTTSAANQFLAKLANADQEGTKPG